MLPIDSSTSFGASETADAVLPALLLRGGEKGMADFRGEVLKPGWRITLFLFVAVDVPLLRAEEIVPGPGSADTLFIRVVGSLELDVSLGSVDAFVSMSSILAARAVVQNWYVLHMALRCNLWNYPMERVSKDARG